ncbi:uncharacterized protein QC761_0028590 [Podospora bellae-mahoneyi]|uniref:Uncharacterized protein n=1 Tax=Podospora bellae-mahoneyi TaxID=2093777 RepID=A0ABR0FT34_9PEZI|nr:hypothetical protein QC761_0028590 [Podospora bellae-mahoneyi]
MASLDPTLRKCYIVGLALVLQYSLCPDHGISVVGSHYHGHVWKLALSLQRPDLPIPSEQRLRNTVVCLVCVLLDVVYQLPWVAPQVRASDQFDAQYEPLLLGFL